MKKILFNDKFAFTEAVLSGRKTQTRRIIKGDVPLGSWKETYKHSRYQVGEVVAVAQCYKHLGYDANALDRSPKDIDIVRGTLGQSAGWNNKLFVRAEACKNRIRITNMRVERLNEISESGCIAEGLSKTENWPFGDFYHINGLNLGNTPREAYAALIDRISGKGTWESNPWVFVYDFELVK